MPHYKVKYLRVKFDQQSLLCALSMPVMLCISNNEGSVPLIHVHVGHHPNKQEGEACRLQIEDPRDKLIHVYT